MNVDSALVYSKNIKKLFTRGEYPELKLFESVLNFAPDLYSLSPGNRIKIYSTQEQIFREMLRCIDNAKERILLETYIFFADHIGVRFVESLTKAVMRGCEVIIICDHFGSYSFFNSAFPLQIQRGSGLSILQFNPFWPWYFRRRSMLSRDHRKILIVDSEISFCGSSNITGGMLSTFRETAIKIQGFATSDLADLFFDSVYEISGLHRVEKRRSIFSGCGSIVHVLSSNHLLNVTSIQQIVSYFLQNANSRCFFTTPYFLPVWELENDILQAVSRGVDIRILMAGKTDVPLMRLAGHYAYTKFLTAGVRIYELFGQTLHSKTVIVDNLCGLIGTYNLDHWSAERNLEVTINISDPGGVSVLDSEFRKDLSNAAEITLSSWLARPLIWRIFAFISYKIMRL